MDLVAVRKWFHCIGAGHGQRCGIGLFSSNHFVNLRSLIWRSYKKLNRYEILYFISPAVFFILY